MKYNVESKDREQHIKDMASEIKAYYKDSGKSEIIICNIGTSKFIGDSVAPLVGTMLQKRKLDIKVYGHLDEQINALNVSEYATYIKKHRDALIIAIDSAISSESDVGTIRLRPIPVNAGLGMRGVGVPIGDISIVAVTSKNKDSVVENNLDVKIIYKMADDISKIIINLDDKIKRSRRRCSRKSLA